jgi:hypothetical protein
MKNPRIARFLRTARGRAKLQRCLAVVLAVLVLSSSGCGGHEAVVSKRNQTQAVRTALIMLENSDYEQVIGSPEMPFLNGLTRRGTLATDYYAVAHPSLPNYLALIGGSTFGIRDDCTECWASGSNLAVQLSRAGISWRGYMEDTPEPCYGEATYGDQGGYAKKHDPFMYFKSITSVPSRCKNVVPATRLNPDLGKDRLPTFTWITPNLCNDAHDCSLASADSWLSRVVPSITQKLGCGGILVVTFDEGSEGTGERGGHVMTLFVGPGARRGKRLNRPFDHYSLLATIENRYGLRRLREARGKPLMNGAIARP